MSQPDIITNGDAHERDSFAFYWSFKDAINAVPSTQEKLEIYEAITDFAFFGKEPDFSSPIGRVCWRAIKTNLIKSMRRYDACVENGRKGAVYGAKGGAPKGNKNAVKQPQKQPQKQPLNVNVNHNHNVCVNTQRAYAHTHTHTQQEIDEMRIKRDEILNDALNNDSAEAARRAASDLKLAEAKLEAATTFSRFYDFLNRRCPDIVSRMELLSEEEYRYWLLTSGKSWLVSTCEKMNGRKDTKEKFDNLHAALKSWWENDYRKEKA